MVLHRMVMGELPQSKPDGFASSLWEGAFGMAVQFPVEPQSLRACPLPLGGAVAQRLRGFKSAEPEKTVKRSSRRTGVNLQFFSGAALCFGVKRGEQPLFRGSSASKSLALFWFSFGVKREHPSACAHNTKKRPALPVGKCGALGLHGLVRLMPPAEAVPQRTGRQ